MESQRKHIKIKQSLLHVCLSFSQFVLMLYKTFNKISLYVTLQTDAQKPVRLAMKVLFLEIFGPITQHTYQVWGFHFYQCEFEQKLI